MAGSLPSCKLVGSLTFIDLTFSKDPIKPHDIFRVAVVAIVYYLLAYYSLDLSFADTNATPVWPPSGFALAAILVYGRRMIAGIFLGALAANITGFLETGALNFSAAILVSILIGIGNSLEALLGRMLIKKWLPDRTLSRFYETVNGTLIFIAASFIVCILTAFIGATALFLGGVITESFFLPVTLTWWTGDVAGILLFTPLLLAWLPPNIGSMRLERKGLVLEGLLLFFAIIFISGLVFQLWFSTSFFFTRAFLITPFLIWGAMRFSLPVVLVAVLCSAFIALYGTLAGQGPFITSSLNASLLTVEAFIAINSVMVLLLNAAIREQRISETRLRSSKVDLEKLVENRTQELAISNQQLAEKNQELERSNRELAAFSYVASHDLQEPLRKIQIFSDSILHADEERLTDKSKSALDRMRIAARHMKQLIVDLLAYSQVSNSRPGMETEDLNEIAREVVAEMKEQIEASGAVVNVGELPKLKVIRFQVNQLFTNLISNALKFARQGTPLQVGIDAKKVTASERPDLHADPGKSYWEISVKDNGIGFDASYSEKIFEIFQRLHSNDNYEGKGIGLAICKKIADNHNGFIRAKGKVNEGAEFCVYLPE